MALLAIHPFPIFMRDLPRRDDIFRLLNFLQEKYYLNANLLLYSVWYALTEHGRLRRPEFKKLLMALHPWHERINSALQQLASSLQRSRLLQQWVLTEVDTANQFEQQMLAQTLGLIKKTRRNPNQPLLDASHNLVTYYKVMRMHVDDLIRQDSLKILSLLFADFSEAQIEQSFDQAVTAARIEDSGFTQLSLV